MKGVEPLQQNNKISKENKIRYGKKLRVRVLFVLTIRESKEKRKGDKEERERQGKRREEKRREETENQNKEERKTNEGRKRRKGETT